MNKEGGVFLARKDKTFAAYLEDQYYDLMFNRLKSYIFQNRSRLDLHTSLIPNPSFVELDDIHVQGVTFKEGENDRILLFRVAVQADVAIKGRSKYDYEDDMVNPWFSIAFSGTLRGGLKDVTITSIEDYSREKFSKEDALTKYLVPYIYSKDLDAHAERFLKKYCPKSLEVPMRLPIDEVLDAMQLSVHFAPLQDGTFGRTYFNNATVEIYNEEHEVVSADIKEGTILVNPDAFFMRNIGSARNTVIHECVHWDKHYKFFELQKLINPKLSNISCAVVEKYDKAPDALSEELSWMEWQANALAPKILIPAKTGRAKFIEIYTSLSKSMPDTPNAELVEYTVKQFAEFFDVSEVAAKIRAIELGFDQAAGVLNYIDGKKCPPFSFTKGTLKKDQTFVIDWTNAILAPLLAPDLTEDVKEGRFLHVNGMMVINDPKYISVQNERAELTEYALAHADECCLVFNRTTRLSDKYDDSFYRICFLCRDVDSKSFVEANYNRKEGQNEDVQKRAREMAAIKEEAARISDILAKAPSSFKDTLNYHMDRREFTNEKLEERSLISSRTIQDYRNKNDARPTLQSVLALCIGLNLQPYLSYDLIRKAGYDINIPNDDYLVYRYLIDHHHMENIHMWNEKLRDAGVSQLLPSNRNQYL